MIRALKNQIHHLQAIIANLVYGSPGKKIKVIGVTGTDGKTTTTTLIYHILTSAKKKAAMISTVNAYIDGKEYDTGFHTTTPSPFQVQKLLKKALEAGAEYVILETTSMGLDQYRVWGVPFRVGVVTNITREHLDYHKTYERYVRAKFILLQHSEKRIINLDDGSFEPLKVLLNTNTLDFQTYSLRSNSADFSIDIAKKAGVEMPEFNKYNALAAYSVVKQLGIADSIVLESLRTFVLPSGRFEVILKSGITAMIDFAHTPNSFLQILPEAQKYRKKNGKLIHIFSSAAHRDKLKRPEMGAISAQYADIIILSEEDYRTENPRKIAEEIAKGIQARKFKHVAASKLSRDMERKYAVIIDRKEAIERAIGMAKPGDVVLTTGKGHEQSLCRGKKEYPWSEKQAVLDAFNTKK